MTQTAYRAAGRAFAIALWTMAVSPAFAQTGKIDGADTAWMVVATAIVLMMTIPGLALFYAGMVRKKNVLATMAQSLVATALVSILWIICGYSLAFTFAITPARPSKAATNMMTHWTCLASMV